MKNSSDRRASIGDIVAEMTRESRACPHVESPRPPVILFGCHPNEIPAMARDLLAEARNTAGHKLRRDAPIAVMGASKALQYGQAVFATGHPSFQTHPSTTYGIVKGLYAMDDSVIVRASSSFMPGDSGGGLFDNTGKLVGVIALKSPGRNAYYYNLAVEWVQALLNQPEQSIHTKSSLPFWAESLENWPHFMRVVQPFLTEDWPALHQVAQEWTLKEPASSEAWFYLAASEYGLRHIDTAEALLTKVVAMNSQHSQALYYLGLIEEDHGKRMEALNRVALLSVLDESIANKLKLAMGMQLEAPQ